MLPPGLSNNSACWVVEVVGSHPNGLLLYLALVPQRPPDFCLEVPGGRN